MKRFKKGMIILMLTGLMSTMMSCSKNNTLEGDTNVDFAQVGQSTSVYINVSGTALPGTSIKVINNTDGMVTYSASVNTKAYPADLIKLLLENLPTALAYYNPKDFTYSISPSGMMDLQFKLKITTEGIQNYLVNGEPWTVRYADGVGTKYEVETKTGETLTAEVTEKTGKDDWSYGFMMIKTSKVEYVAPEEDKVIKKVTYRVNHKFGLVYLKAEFRNGKVAEVDLL